MVTPLTIIYMTPQEAAVYRLLLMDPDKTTRLERLREGAQRLRELETDPSKLLRAPGLLQAVEAEIAALEAELDASV